MALGAIDGEPIAVSASDDNTLRLWNLRSGQGHGAPLRGHEDRVNAVALGAIDGEPIAVSASDDNTLRLWDVRSGKSEPLRGHEDWVNAVALGAIDGEPIAVSASYDNTLRVWDLRSGKAVLTVMLDATPLAIELAESKVVVGVTNGLMCIQFAAGILSRRGQR